VVAYQPDEAAPHGDNALAANVPNPAGFSFGLGSARQNPDGSLIISWGALRPLFEELDAQGQRLLAVTEAAPDALAHRFLKEPLGSYDRQVLMQFAGGDAEAPSDSGPQT
jgi:hypothetical protein